MNKQRKAELEESLSNALEPPRKKNLTRLNDILSEYIDPRDEHISKESGNATIAHRTRVVSHTTLVQPTTLVNHSTLAPQAGEPWHDTRVEPSTTLEQHTRVAQPTIIETEYTKTPNDLWDELMPTLDPYDQIVLWQLYRLSRGYHRDTCTIGFPRLAKRCNISPKQAQISVGRLEKRSLIKRLGSDFGNRNVAERGNIYEVCLPEGKEAPRTRVARDTRVANPTRVVQDATMKLNTQKENTQTQMSGSVGSRFTLDECQRYANHLKQTGQGINNPGGYATMIYRSGEADTLINQFLKPPIDINNCPDCLGSGNIYIDPNDLDKGVRRCAHTRLLGS